VIFHSSEGYRHASWNGTGWDLETITSDTGSPAWMDVAVDGSDTLHVVYSRLGGSVRYTRGTSGSWSTPEALAPDGENPALAVTAAGQPHVVFRDSLDDRLLHVTR
jgi:hypothetical protein